MKLFVFIHKRLHFELWFVYLKTTFCTRLRITLRLYKDHLDKMEMFVPKHLKKSGKYVKCLNFKMVASLDVRFIFTYKRFLISSSKLLCICLDRYCDNIYIWSA